ncbi:MAG: hypothetical protein Q7T55_22635, partial [Solirubrobacteraceae bacterium]|nr:hypothetical protein [Solirubrobacteraceae bacterium]
GVPTITLAGDTPAGRQGASILRHSGLAELIAHDEAEFTAIGAALPSDLGRLAAIRAGLRERFATPSSSDMDGVGLGTELALRAMWRRWCDGLAPAPLQIELPAP